MNLQLIIKNAIRKVPASLRATITITKTNPGTTNAITEARPGDTTSSYSVSTVIENAKPDRADDGTVTKRTSRSFFAAALDCTFPPEAGHLALVAGEAKSSRVLGATPILPNGQVIGYQVEISR